MKIRTLLIPALALLSAASSAQTYVEYGGSLSLGMDGYAYDQHQGDAPDGLSKAELDMPGYGWGNMTANVGPGVAKSAFEIHGTSAENPVSFATAFASSRWFDSFTISDAALNGTAGTFTTTLFVRGIGDFRIDDSISSSLSTSMDAFWHAVINVTADGINDENGLPVYQSGLYAGEWFKDKGETGLTYYGDVLGTYQQEVEFQFVYGQPVSVDSFLQCIMDYDNQEELVQGTFDVNVDLGHSSYWAGLRSVKDANGNELSNYGFASASGFDYRQDYAPVPEPASMLALAGGVAVLLKRRRKAV
ncbi:PEP-CTERM sorting domain-containing protein [bacterium]|nr:MAG: PEP-CTERM sorting domain-containing protein [bacterium]